MEPLCMLSHQSLGPASWPCLVRPECNQVLNALRHTSLVEAGIWEQSGHYPAELRVPIETFQACSKIEHEHPLTVSACFRNPHDEGTRRHPYNMSRKNAYVRAPIDTFWYLDSLATEHLRNAPSPPTLGFAPKNADPSLQQQTPGACGHTHWTSVLRFQRLAWLGAARSPRRRRQRPGRVLSPFHPVHRSLKLPTHLEDSIEWLKIKPLSNN